MLATRALVIGMCALLFASAPARGTPTSAAVTHPPLLLDVVRGALEAIGIQAVGAVAVLGIALLYGRKALNAGSLAGSWMRMGLFAIGVLLVLVLTGIVPTLRFDVALDLGRQAIDAVSGVTP